MDDLYAVRLARMPRGMRTPGLISHETEEGLVPSVLENGILSMTRQHKKLGRVFSGAHPDLPEHLGLFNYVSVYDPYAGYGSRLWHESAFENAKSQIREMYFEHERQTGTTILSLKKILESFGFVETLPKDFMNIRPHKDTFGCLVYSLTSCNDADKETTETIFTSRFDGGFEKKVKTYSQKPESRYVKFETTLPEKNRELFVRAEQLFQEIMSGPEKEKGFPSEITIFRAGSVRFRERPFMGETTMDIGLDYKLNNTKEVLDPLSLLAAYDYPRFIISPSVERFPMQSYYCCESFVPGQIIPEDIVALVLPSNYMDCRFISDLIAVAKKFKMPVFESSVSKDKSFGFKLLPNA